MIFNRDGRVARRYVGGIEEPHRVRLDNALDCRILSSGAGLLSYGISHAFPHRISHSVLNKDGQGIIQQRETERQQRQDDKRTFK